MSLISAATPVNSTGPSLPSNNATSYTTRQIKTDHKDLIQDIAFDFYGKRVATASLDQSVRIWNINENNEWIFKEELKVFCYKLLQIIKFVKINHINR